VGIDILERGGGRAIDELVVELPDATLVSLLLAEVNEVDGVDVEDVRRAPERLHDPCLDALATAEAMGGAPTSMAMLEILVARASIDFETEWSDFVDLDARAQVASEGAPPPPAWLVAFVSGSWSSAAVAAGECGPDDVAWAGLVDGRLALVLGRRGRPFRARERRQLAAMARIADLRLTDLERLAPPATVAGTVGRCAWESLPVVATAPGSMP